MQPDELIARYRQLRVGVSSPQWRALSDELDALITANDAERLCALGELLARESDDPFHLAKRQTLNGLALIRTPQAVDAFMQRSRGGDERERAALLAHAQDVGALERAVEVHADQPELLLCWIQECVTRGGDLREARRIRAFWNQHAAHPLHQLPLELAPLEAPLFNEHLRRDWLGNWFFFARAVYPNLMLATPHAANPATPRTDFDDALRAQAACFIGDSRLYPNAEFELGVFPVKPLTSLELACLSGAREVREVPMTPREAFNTLFVMATQGGAYGRGRSAAYGRLRAWHCAAALTGTRANVDFSALVTAVERAEWTFFDADTRWWNHVCIDFGLTCRVGETLRALAATDSD